MENNLVKLVPFDKEVEVSEINYTVPYGVEMTNAKFMWQSGYTGKGVVIAIIDTGCNITHPALQGRIIGGRNFTTDDSSNPDIYEDYQGHGTHVAGTIAATFEQTGITGVAPEASLLILKALDRNGSGNYDWLINAINYAIEKKVDVISMSLGGSQDVPELHDVIKNAINNNIVVVCAAGNRGDSNGNTKEYDYPGAYYEVVEVGAIDQNKGIASFSNSNEFVDLVAPGVSIVSTFKNQGYATLSGTSMATPHVSGGVAILIEWARKELGRSLTEPELYEQLIKSTIALSVERSMQGNGYLYLNPVKTN